MAREEREEEDNEGIEADYEGVLQTHVRYHCTCARLIM